MLVMMFLRCFSCPSVEQFSASSFSESGYAVASGFTTLADDISPTKDPSQNILSFTSVDSDIQMTTDNMKEDEVTKYATAFAQPDFKKIEPELLTLDKYLTLRSYIDGYTISPADVKIWVALRQNKVANAFLKKGSMVNVTRWFQFIEQTHPEIQSEIKVADEAAKAKRMAASKAGASYNMALQDVEKGVVTRFPPEPSYEILALV